VHVCDGACVGACVGVLVRTRVYVLVSCATRGGLAEQEQDMLSGNFFIHSGGGGMAVRLPL